MKKTRIVIVSDCKDAAYNEMRQSIFNYLGEDSKSSKIEIEPLVPVSNFSLINAAFLTRLMAEIYPKGTIFMTIMGPTKERSERIFGETENGQLFIGANSGVFSWLIEDFGINRLFSFKQQEWIPFGGKFVSAKIAAEIALGKSYEKIGINFCKDKVRTLKIPLGTIVHIDNFGIMKIREKPLSITEGQEVDIYLNNKKCIQAIYAERMMDYDDGQWVVYNGSSLDRLPELARVRVDTSAQDINAQIGDIVKWKIRED